MLKNILKLNGANQLTRTQQKNINGGAPANCASSYMSGFSADGEETICIARIGGQTSNGFLSNIGGTLYCCIN